MGYGATEGGWLTCIVVMRGGLWGHRRGLAYLFSGDEGWAMGPQKGAGAYLYSGDEGWAMGPQKGAGLPV